MGMLVDPYRSGYITTASDWVGGAKYGVWTPFPSGITDSTKFTVSFFFRYTGNNNGSSVIGADRFGVRFLSGQHPSLYAIDSGGLSLLAKNVTATITPGSGWHHYAASADLSGTPLDPNTTFENYIDGILVSAFDPVEIARNGTINWEYNLGGSDWRFGQLANICLSEFYLNTDEKVTLASGGINKFRNPATGKPVYLGDTGALPSGSQPAIYFRKDPSANLGYANSATLIGGALSICSTSPSD